MIDLAALDEAVRRFPGMLHAVKQHGEEALNGYHVTTIQVEYQLVLRERRPWPLPVAS